MAGSLDKMDRKKSRKESEALGRGFIPRAICYPCLCQYTARRA